MKTIILGAGLSGLSTAYFLQDKKEIEQITILEKEDRPGGLCRSIRKDGYLYDIGPHILFSKDKEMLELMLSMLEEKNDLRRSNQILYRGRYVQYPFENDLSKLPEKDLKYCINSFNHNPYENYEADNMIQFFLKTFGEGITNCYLRPYNEKIWKYDPAFMNTSMVDRIPKPTKEEIRRSAAGETVDGYVHQLYFSYPTHRGIESVPNAFLSRLKSEKCTVNTNSEVVSIHKENDLFQVITADGAMYAGEQLISTIPVQALTAAYKNSDEELQHCVDELRYNSIAICFVRTPYDHCGENFTFTIPDREVIFHRISKMDFLGAAYHKDNEATFMVEVTYRKNDRVDLMTDNELRNCISDGMVHIGFAEKADDVDVIDISRQQYAYVIYDLNHAENMEKIRAFYKKQGILLNGRFGNFEYWNMDRILRESFKLSESIKINNN